MTGGAPRLRSLVIAPHLPHPCFSGADLRVWQNTNALAGLGPVGVFGLCSNDPRVERVPAGPVLWRVASDPALAYPPPRGVRIAARAWMLEPDGHPWDACFSESAARELDEVVRDFDPDVVVLSTLALHRYAHRLRGGRAALVLDAHNVEAAVWEQMAAAASEADPSGRLVRALVSERTRSIEARTIGAVDQVWACSEDDARQLRERYRPVRAVEVVPNGVDVDAYEQVRLRKCPVPVTGDPGPHAVLYPALFAYPPNAAAARYLIDELLPHLAAVADDVALLLVGNHPTKEMQAAAARDPRVLVTGAVEDVRPYLAAASVLVAPLFEGGGTRLKLLEAFASGVPVVSTRKGAEGLGVRDGEHLLLADTVESMAAAVRSLWEEPRRAEALAARARALVQERHSWAAVRRRVAELLRGLRPVSRARGEGRAR